MAAKLRLLAEQLTVSLSERQRLVESGVPTSPDDDEELERSLATLDQGIHRLAGNGSSYLNEVEDRELQALRATRALIDRSMAATYPTFRDDTEDCVGTQENISVAAPYRDQIFDGMDSFRDGKLRKSVRFSENLQQHDVPVQELLQTQTSVISQQDRSLDILSQSISKQRELSIQIGDELDQQNCLLDEVDDMVERNSSKLEAASRRLRTFSNKAKQNGSLTTIFVLLLVLIIILAL